MDKKPAARPVPADDDWLNDLGDSEDSPGKLPPIVRKKNKKQAREGIDEQKRPKKGRELPPVVHYLMMAGTGLIGGLIGAAIWAGLIYFTGYEIGYVAVFVGFLSGVGVRFGANQWDYGLGPGLTAVAVAILALIVGKIAGIQLIIHREMGNLQAPDRPAIHENIFIAALAEEVKAAQPNAKATGAPNTPAQADEEVFDPEKLPQQYPPEIWNQAKARWDEVPDAKKREILDEGAKQFQELAKPDLSSLFGPFDFLWFFLAIGAAFRAATGGLEE